MKKKRTFQNFLRSFRGFSLSVLGIGGGVSFAPPTNERETVLKLISQLGDRRVLFHSGCGVPRRDMIASAEKMRSNITAAFEQIPESRAASFLAPMRQALSRLSDVSRSQLPFRRLRWPKGRFLYRYRRVARHYRFMSRTALFTLPD